MPWQWTRTWPFSRPSQMLAEPPAGLSVVLVNECSGKRMLPALMSDLCFSVCLSVTKFMLPSKTNQLSRNSTADLSLSRNSRGRAEHLSRNSRGVEDRSRNSRGGQRSQVSVQGLRPHRIHPLCVHARCFCSVQKKSIPSIRALAFSFFSDINRHHFSSVSELEAEGEPCR